MQTSKYLMTIPYNDYLKLIDEGAKYQNLKNSIIDCYDIKDYEVNQLQPLYLDVDKLTNIANKLLPWNLEGKTIVKIINGRYADHE